MVIRGVSLQHKGGHYHYKLHNLKLNSLGFEYPKLIWHLNRMFEDCPNDYFENGPRSSALKFKLNDLNVHQIVGHEISNLCRIGLSVNRERFRDNHQKVQVFMLENVKNLKSHDKGKTYKVISDTLKLLNYKIFVKIVDAKHYVPQHRERIFIVGFDKKKFRNIKFKFPKMPEARRYELDEILLSDVDNKYTLTERLWLYLKNYAKKHRERGNGFGYGLIDSTKDKYTRTLSARYYKDGSEILIKQDKRRPRRLTPRECARLMGFDDSFKIVVSDTQAYRQFGNSLVVPVVEDIASKIVNHLNTGKKYGQNYNKAQKLEHVAYQV